MRYQLKLLEQDASKSPYRRKPSIAVFALIGVAALVLHSQSSLGKALVEHVSPASVNRSLTTMLQNFFGVATNLVALVGAAAVITFLGLHYAGKANLYTGGLLELVPRPHRGRGAEILQETARAISYWMLGRLVSMTALGYVEDVLGAGLQPKPPLSTLAMLFGVVGLLLAVPVVVCVKIALEYYYA